MNSPLVDARVVLGVTGSIACYKAADLASKLMQEGARVDVVLTRGASNFVTPLTFRSLTHRPVITDLFDADSEQAVNHVAMAHEADVVLVAPATAHVIAKLAHGFADDALTTTALPRRRLWLLRPPWTATCSTIPPRRRTSKRCDAAARPSSGRSRGTWPPV